MADTKVEELLLREILDAQREMVERISQVERDSEETLARVNALMLGFPGGDMDGHRRYHEGVIEWQALRNRLVLSALEKMAGAGALAGFGWLLYAIWITVRMEVKK